MTAKIDIARSLVEKYEFWDTAEHPDGSQEKELALWLRQLALNQLTLLGTKLAPLQLHQPVPIAEPMLLATLAPLNVDPTCVLID